MGLNSDFQLESKKVVFHPCVDLLEYDKSSEIVYFPPDEPFELCSYEMNLSLMPVFDLEFLFFEVSSTKMEIRLLLKSNFSFLCVAENVQIEVPVPVDLDEPQFFFSAGEAKVDYEKEAVLWQMEEMEGDSVEELVITFSVPSVRIVNKHAFKSRPIESRFIIKEFTVSGISVDYLKVDEVYQADTEVSFKTENGVYRNRLL